MNFKDFNEVVTQGYSLDGIFLLKFIKEGERVFQGRMNIIIQALKRKNLISGDWVLSEKAEELVNTIGSLEEERGEIESDKNEESISGEELFCLSLRKKLQDRLNELIGKKQIMGFGGKYFIPTHIELKKALQDFRKYGYDKLYNEKRITHILLKHLNSCAKKKSFAPAIQYYIIKDKTNSQLASALENYEEEKKEKTEEETNTTLVNPKDLF